MNYHLSFATIILCAFSNIFLAITAFILQNSSMIKGVGNNISKSICLMLFCGNIFLIFTNPIYFDEIPEWFCKFIGISMHYFYISAFVWMGLMGWHLFIIIFSPFDSHENAYFVYQIIGFGIPAFWVGCVAGISQLTAYSGGEEDL